MSKKRNKTGQNQEVVNPFELRSIAPLTVNQTLTFDAYAKDLNLMLHGYAGTGKTFISSFLAIREVLSGRTGRKRVLNIRSGVPSRDMGFLPGTQKEKARMYELPFKQIYDDLFGRGDGYEILKLKNLVEFETTSYLRGLTWNDTIIIVDEMQNMTFQELDTVMTRVGDNSKIIFCGDFRQTDLSDREKTGLLKFINITKRMNRFCYVDFGKSDIVRSGLVKDYIIKRTELELM